MAHVRTEVAAVRLLAVVSLLCGTPVAAQSDAPPNSPDADEAGAEPGADASRRPTSSTRPDAPTLSATPNRRPNVTLPCERPTSEPPAVAASPGSLASGLTAPRSLGGPPCGRWAPSDPRNDPHPARTGHPDGPPVPSAARAKGFDFGRLSLEALGGLGGIIVAALAIYPLSLVGALRDDSPSRIVAWVAVEVGQAVGVHLSGRWLDVEGSFAAALGSTLLGTLIYLVVGEVAMKGRITPAGFLLTTPLVGTFLYGPAIIYEWTAGVYDD